MGKKSIKENKTIYQLHREALNLTREAASNQMDCISADRIEKIESQKSLPHPDEILTMAECYKAPNLCNYFCSHECPIGQKNVPPIKMKDLSQIVLEMLATLNILENDKNRFIEITADGAIDDSEIEDFVSIQEKLNRISMVANTLQLWVEQTIADGIIDKEKLRR